MRAAPGNGTYRHPAPAASGLTGTAEVSRLQAEKKSRSRRILASVGGGLLLAVIAGVVVLVIRSGSGTPSAPSGNLGQATAQNALGSGSTVPAVTARRLGNGAQVLFSWTYNPHKSGDTFPWKGVGGAAAGTSGVAGQPQLTLTVATGQTACVEVWVKRAKGGQLSVPTTTCSS